MSSTIIGTAPQQGVHPLLLAGNWEECWREQLAIYARLGIHDLHLTDFDGTVYGDILVLANEALGPIDPSTGEKRWRLYDRAFKDANGAKIDPARTVIPDRATIKGDRMFMTNGGHLDAEYRDLMAVMRELHPDADPIAELAAWAAANVPLIAGATDFVNKLGGMNIATLGITNGAWQIAEALLKRHGLEVPFMGNYFENSGFRCVHGDDIGVDKARLVDIAHDAGFRIVSCAGDSKGDIGLCTATAKHGGLVIVRGSEGGLADWAEKNLRVNQWVLVEDYNGSKALTAVQQRIQGEDL